MECFPNIYVVSIECIQSELKLMVLSNDISLAMNKCNTSTIIYIVYDNRAVNFSDVTIF